MSDQSSSRKSWWPLAGVVLACVLIVLLAWDIYERFVKTVAPPEFETFGQYGPTSASDMTGRSFLKFPYWEKGDRLVLGGYVEYFGKPLGPAFLMLLRKKEKQHSYWGSEAGSGGESKVHLYAGFLDSNKQPWWIKAVVTNAPITEQFSLGEKSYTLEDGRLFLADLRTQPATVTQLKEDIAALLPKEDATKDDLLKAVQQLQEKNETIRQFWTDK